MAILGSGLAGVDESLQHLRAMTLTDFAPTDAQVRDTMLALGNLDEPAARTRAGLQNLATHMRPALRRGLAGYLSLGVGPSDDALVLRATDIGDN